MSSGCSRISHSKALTWPYPLAMGNTYGSMLEVPRLRYATESLSTNKGWRGMVTSTSPVSCHPRSRTIAIPSGVSTMSPSHFMEYSVATWANDQL